jgi:AcrR family transcriptional regulator
MFYRGRLSLRKNTVDRRVQKTRKLLHDALISLTLEKNYESIIVQEILDRANVGRSTFYIHFRDKDELLIEGFHDLRDVLRGMQMRKPVAAKSYENVVGFSLAMFEHANEYRDVWKALSGSQAGTIVRQHIQDMLAELVRDKFRIEYQERKRVCSRIPLELFVNYLASTYFMVMSWWLDCKNPLSGKEINDVYLDLVTPVLETNFA